MISLETSRIVWERAEGRCEYLDANGSRCSRPLDFRGLQRSHKIHRKMGGRKGEMKVIIDHPDNLQLFCAYHHDLFDGRIKAPLDREPSEEVSFA